MVVQQNDPLKQAVAWFVKSRTVVGDSWICQELDMGSRVNVSRAVCAFRHAPDRVRKKLKKKMRVCTDPSGRLGSDLNGAKLKHVILTLSRGD
jgi:hypothetical protein